MLTSKEKPVVIGIWKDRGGYADIKVQGLSIRLNNLKEQDPEQLYEKLAKAVGKKIAKDFFRKAYVEYIWEDSKFVEEMAG